MLSSVILTYGFFGILTQHSMKNLKIELNREKSKSWLLHMTITIIIWILKNIFLKHYDFREAVPTCLMQQRWTLISNRWFLSDTLTTVDTTVLLHLVLRNKGSGLLSIVSKVIFKSQQPCCFIFSVPLNLSACLHCTYLLK